MIKKTKSFETTDGTLFNSIEGAQMHELLAFLDETGIKAQFGPPEELAKALIAKKDRIVDLLIMKANSHPKARKSNGATRKPRQTAPTASLTH